MLTKFPACKMLIRLLFIAMSYSAHADDFGAHFYRIIAPGQRRSEASYALGTIHVQIHLHDLPPKMITLFDQSRILLSEVALSAEECALYPTDPYAVALHTYPFVGQGDELNPLSRSALHLLGVADEFLAKLKDQDCGVFDLLRQTRQSEPPMDLEWMARAHDENIEVLGLTPRDSTLDQVDAPTLHKCSLNTVFAIATVGYIAQKIDDVRESVANYLSGKDISESSGAESLQKRNALWLPTILSQVKKGRSFIAIGDVHLEGKMGILQEFRARGFRVERVFKKEQSFAATAQVQPPAMQ